MGISSFIHVIGACTRESLTSSQNMSVSIFLVMRTFYTRGLASVFEAEIDRPLSLLIINEDREFKRNFNSCSSKT